MLLLVFLAQSLLPHLMGVRLYLLGVVVMM
jgi:hypothetical protein